MNTITKRVAFFKDTNMSKILNKEVLLVFGFTPVGKEFVQVSDWIEITANRLEGKQNDNFSDSGYFFSYSCDNGGC